MSGYVTHPYTTIQESLDELGRTPADLVATGLIDEVTALALYYGLPGVAIDHPAAQALEQVTGVPVSFWVRRWEQYRVWRDAQSWCNPAEEASLYQEWRDRWMGPGPPVSIESSGAPIRPAGWGVGMGREWWGRG